MGDLARWSVKVSKETDISLRTYLAENGGKKGDLSKFVERAVNTELLRATIRKIQDRNAHVPADVLQAEIDQACAETRAEFWKDRKWWND
jgi:hypothetical protein